jgi:hypothetical protein
VELNIKGCDCIRRHDSPEIAMLQCKLEWLVSRMDEQNVVAREDSHLQVDLTQGALANFTYKNCEGRFGDKSIYKLLIENLVRSDRVSVYDIDKVIRMVNL